MALKEVLGTPISFTTLSKTPYGESACIVPATTLAAAPTRMASNKAIASLERTSPTKIAESPNRRVDRIPIDGSTSEPGADKAEATFSDSML